MTANNGTAGNSYGGYRESGYTTVGYGINTKKWTKYNGSTNPRTPVVKIGYAGARVAVEARVSGKMVSSLNNNGIGGATVSLGGPTVTTDTSGSISFPIDAVDMDATHPLPSPPPASDDTRPALYLSPRATPSPHPLAQLRSQCIGWTVVEAV